ncbi:hypothetical protein NYZ99_05930 [Maribacter litopenaei]|uniref:FUSC family protein n=1 Tax=Maribacter litopenaei TaxID=2976127 RepID=A0ABY5YA51_9FLAO|nr:hypothetical protein [Maribacter litopenaei]UWX55918.1 hypothetical protein NYZ99_05930 [Maribacter litopenaei]
MPDSHIEQEYIREKIKLVLKVNYITSILAIAMGVACLVLLDITRVIPHVLILYGVANLINTFLYKTTKNISLTYHVSSLLALISALLVTLYSGGINSSFIFMLALVVFAGYVNTHKHGRVYLYFTFAIILFVFSQSFPS